MHVIAGYDVYKSDSGVVYTKCLLFKIFTSALYWSARKSVDATPFVRSIFLLELVQLGFYSTQTVPMVEDVERPLITFPVKGQKWRP